MAEEPNNATEAQLHVQIEPRLPRFNGKGAYSPELDSLVGARILRIGTCSSLGLEGGGLLLEVDRGDGVPKVIAFEFSEVGMWHRPIPREINMV